MPPVVIGPRCNRRVTYSDDVSNRSESAIAINPNNPYNMIGASKRFTDPLKYHFTVAMYYTFDGGQSWNESPPLILLNTNDIDDGGVIWTDSPWSGVTDPTIAWDDIGNAYLVGLAVHFWPTGAMTFHGIAVYKSIDGGRTWSLPKVIHKASDDKQWAAGDSNPASPYHGHVYAAWNDMSPMVGGLAFTRTKDHGASWIGFGAQPSGAVITKEMVYAEINVARDGTVYIFGLNTASGIPYNITFMKSTDGGESFSPPAIVASGITLVPGKLPGGSFRVMNLPTACCGTGNHLVCAWPDYREGVARIYYNHSNNGGSSWQGSSSGDPLLTGVVASAADQHDFMPQIVSTPDGVIGCAFYEFGPKGTSTPLINVVLAVSTDNAQTFPHRVGVTNRPWDPAVDPVWRSVNPVLTFIGDYFGLDASRLGFFPFWTDTRDGKQEIYTARLAVNPADVFIRDSGSDTGAVPSPGNHWEAVDLIVRRQADGDINFVNQDLLRDGVTQHFVYGRVTNKGPNDARNVSLAVTVANWPKLASLPGTEFRYPQDWYPDDWDPALQANRLWLGESNTVNILNGQTTILGPISWPADKIPNPDVPNPWHPCLLAEVRADNNDSAGGIDGCDMDADPSPYSYGSYFWGNNNVCQRNLSYVTVLAPTASIVEFPFIIGSRWSQAHFLEVIVHKGSDLALTPMTLKMGPNAISQGTIKASSRQGKLVLVDEGPAIGERVRSDMGRTLDQPHISALPIVPDTCYGGKKVGKNIWSLTHHKASVGFPVAAGEMRQMMLSFNIPASLKPGTHTLVRIFQRNDNRVITGSVILELRVAKRPNPKKKIGSV